VTGCEPFVAVQRFFAALSVRDAAAISATVTPDFLLLERGETWDCRKLIDAVQGDYQRRNFFALIESEEFDQRAWVAYWNRAVIERPDGDTSAIVWLESAILQRTGAGWRVRMLHSTNTEAGNIPRGVDLAEYVQTSRS
jgi:ketosteroid isomerase-like protein